jgi:ABC-type transport system involved in multi-copper enzyme maturation permease subunit
MRSALAAEWRKLMGHTRAVSFLVWIYPIGALVIVLLLEILPGLFIESVRDLAAVNPPMWTEDLLIVWNTMNGFPGGTFLRMPFLGFIAIAFAGEYQWGTWKNILPRQSRTKLILSKFLILGLLILLSLLLTSLVITAGGWVTAVLFDLPYGPPLAELDLAAFLQEAAMQVLVTFAGTLIVAAYAALIAMYSRSIIASLLLSVGLSIVEFAASLILLIISQALQRPEIVNALMVTPTYNLENIRSWVVEGAGSTLGGFPGFTAVPLLPTSIVIIVLWLVGLLGLTAVVFRRQDITT